MRCVTSEVRSSLMVAPICAPMVPSSVYAHIVSAAVVPPSAGGGRTRCSGGIEVQHRMAPARGIWLVPESCEWEKDMVECVAAHHTCHGPYPPSSMRWRKALSRAARATSTRKSRSQGAGTRCGEGHVRWIKLKSQMAATMARHCHSRPRSAASNSRRHSALSNLHGRCSIPFSSA